MVQPKSSLSKNNNETTEKSKPLSKKKNCSSGCGSEATANSSTCKSETTMKKGNDKSRIVVHYDCGFPNTLYLRGTGSNLNWNKGIPMKNQGPNTWFWETDADLDSCEFKVLLNDQIYETGSNHSLKKGKCCEYTPRFDFGH